MGWKSTKTIKRSEAIRLIEAYLENATNDELSNTLEGLGYGDNLNLPHHGCNFTVEDDFIDSDPINAPNKIP